MANTSEAGEGKGQNGHPGTAASAPPKVDPKAIGRWVKDMPEKDRKRLGIGDMSTAEQYEAAKRAYLEAVAKDPDVAAEPAEGPTTVFIGFWDQAKRQVTDIESAPSAGKGPNPAPDSELGKLLARKRAQAEMRGLVLGQVRLRG